MTQNHPALPQHVTWERGGDATGTHLQSELTGITYKELVDTFGPPTSDGDGYKVDAEWELSFSLFGGMTVHVATIYNYKDGKNYLGKEGTPVEKITDWHIGGKYSEVVGYISSMLLANRKATQ